MSLELIHRVHMVLSRFHNCTYGHVTDATIGPRSLVVYFVAPS